MPNTTTSTKKNPTEERRGGNCFCFACKKQGFRRSELSGAFLCPRCRNMPGVQGYEDPATRGLRDPKTQVYWEEIKHTLNIIGADDGARTATPSPPQRFNIATVEEDPTYEEWLEQRADSSNHRREAPEMQLDNKHRRFLEWTVADSGLPATKRNMLRAILLHQGAKGLSGKGKMGDDKDRKGTPCTASYATLAREAGLSEIRFRALLHRSQRHVHRQGGPGARKLWVTMLYDKDSVKPLRAWWKQSVGEEVGGDRPPVNRFYWLRTLARNRKLCNMPHHAVVFGVAAVVDLLMNSRGKPYKWTTVAEIAQLSGYSAHHVRRALKTLEGVLGVLEIQRRDGRGGGLLIFLLEAAAKQLNTHSSKKKHSLVQEKCCAELKAQTLAKTQGSALNPHSSEIVETYPY